VAAAASITLDVGRTYVLYIIFYDRWKRFYYVCGGQRRQSDGRYVAFTAVFVLSCRDHNNIVVFIVHITLRT